MAMYTSVAVFAALLKDRLDVTSEEGFVEFSLDGRTAGGRSAGVRLRCWWFQNPDNFCRLGRVLQFRQERL